MLVSDIIFMKIYRDGISWLTTFVGVIMFRFVKKMFRRDNNMEETKKENVAEEVKKDEVVKDDTDKTTETETKKENVEATESTEKVDNEGAEGKQEEVSKEETTEQGVVDTVDAVGNGISVDDLVTKSDLKASLDALNAKFDALFKEISDKDAKIKEYSEKANDLENKFVNNGDFGNTVSKSSSRPNETEYETFESYSAKFDK